jgi:hypothetical protein
MLSAIGEGFHAETARKRDTIGANDNKKQPRRRVTCPNGLFRFCRGVLILFSDIDQKGINVKK